MLTVRLTPDMENEIDRLASAARKTKSDIVKDALKEYIESHQERGSSYELGEDLFGIEESGEADRSTTYKRRVREKVRAKHTH
jgi:predicted DNA-binding protein